MSAAIVRTRHPASRFKAMGLALLVHVLLLGLVTLNWRATSVNHAPANVIQARAVTEVPQKIKAPKVNVELEKARKQKQANARRKANQIKKQKIAKRRAVAKREAAAKRRHKQARDLLQQQLAAEESERNLSRNTIAAQNKAAKYIDLIGKKVSGKWRRPPGTAKDAYCIVRVRVTAGGRVLSVTIVRSSGDPAFDRATENAIYLAEPLPMPQDVDVFKILKEFNIDTQKL